MYCVVVERMNSCLKSANNSSTTAIRIPATTIVIRKLERSETAVNDSLYLTETLLDVVTVV